MTTPTSAPRNSGALFAWGDLFTVVLPEGVATRDLEHAVELLPAAPGPDGASEGDEREASRAWLSVFGPLAGPLADEARQAIQRFAGTVGVELPADAIALAPKDGVLWARSDFDDRRATPWTAVAIAWNAHLALFLASGVDRHPDFAAALDAMLASWTPLEPVTSSASLGDEPDGDF